MLFAALYALRFERLCILGGLGAGVKRWQNDHASNQITGIGLLQVSRLISTTNTGASIEDRQGRR